MYNTSLNHLCLADVIFIYATDNDMADNGIIVIDGSQISSTGSISIYSDIQLKGDATITTSKCIASYNSSKIIIDLT